MNKMVNQLQRVQNVTKSTLFFLIIFHYTTSFSQKKIQGKYFVKYQLMDFSTIYNFRPRGVFEYESASDLGKTSYGKGHYHVKNDSLVLNYNLTELKTESYHKLKKYYNSKDSLQIKLKIYNFNGKVVPDANFQVYKFPDYSTADVNNKNVFILKNKKKTKERINVIIEALGYDRHDIYLDADKSYDIEVFMAEIEGIQLPRAYKGDVVKFKVVEITNDYIKLKNKDRKTVTWTKQKE